MNIPICFVLLFGIIIGATVMIIGWFVDAIEADKRAKRREQEAYDRGYRKAERWMEEELDIVETRIEMLEDEVIQWIGETTGYNDLMLIAEFEPFKGKVTGIEI